MNRRIAFPFLTIPDACVDAAPWLVSVNDGAFQTNPGSLSAWDYASRVQLARNIAVDFKKCSASLDIDEKDLHLSVVVTLGTGDGRFPRSIEERIERELTRGASEAKIVLDVPSKRLSGILRIETQILLSRAPTRDRPLAPKQLGARLWSDQHDVQVEQTSPRFPIEAVSFRNSFPGRPQAEALWYLHWSPSDLERDVSGSMRLYVNKDRDDFMERLRALDKITLQAISADVISQVLSHFVRLDDVIGHSVDAEPGSLAAQAANWLQLAFPGQSPPQVRSTLEARPGDFHSAVLAAADLGEV